MKCKTVDRSLLGMVFVMLTSLSSIPASAATIKLYDADPDNDIMTPAPDPTTMGWGIINTAGGTSPSAGFSNPGSTTGGAPAWILNDAGLTGAAGRDAGNQANTLYYDLDASMVTAMHAYGFTLTFTFEQLATPTAGGVVGIGVDNDVDNDFGLTTSSRFLNTPPVATGLQTLVYSWDGTSLTTPAGSSLSTAGSDVIPYWVGPNDGGMRIFFADNSQNNSRFNMAITNVTLEAVPEPAAYLMMSLGMLGGCAWRKCRV